MRSRLILEARNKYIHVTCLYAHTCTHIYTHTYVHEHTYMYMYVCVCVCIHTYIYVQIYICTYIYIFVCVYMHSYMRIPMCIYINSSVYVHTYICPATTTARRRSTWHLWGAGLEVPQILLEVPDPLVLRPGSDPST